MSRINVRPGEIHVTSCPCCGLVHNFLAMDAKTKEVVLFTIEGRGVTFAEMVAEFRKEFPKVPVMDGRLAMQQPGKN